MSVVVCGIDKQVRLLHNYLLNFRALCQGASVLQHGIDRDQILLETKYYSAIVQLIHATIGSSVDLSVEGFIMLPSPLQSDMSSSAYDVARKAAEEDIGLRILVALSDDEHAHSSDAIRGYEDWAIDHGYEFIEISATDITASHTEREKFGLPRLMEALESNMWSTMQRRTTHSAGPASGVRASQSSIQSSEEAPPLPKPSAPAVGAVEEEITAASRTVETNTAGVSADPQSASVAGEQAASAQHVDQNDDRDPFEQDMADTEDNEIIDKYSNFISEVKEFRQLSLSGGLSDQARRDQAAAMAMKLSQMFGLDESDSDSDA